MNGATVLIIFTLLFLCSGAGCGGWIENRAVMKQEAPSEAGIEPDLVRANIETTDYSAIVFIMRGKVKEKSALRRLGGYVNHIYQARVLETIKGPRYETITFSVMAESDIDPILPEYPMVVSLCGSGPHALYVPDNGYELPATSVLAAAARGWSRHRAGKKGGVTNVCRE